VGTEIETAMGQYGAVSRLKNFSRGSLIGRPLGKEKEPFPLEKDSRQQLLNAEHTFWNVGKRVFNEKKKKECERTTQEANADQVDGPNPCDRFREGRRTKSMEKQRLKDSTPLKYTCPQEAEKMGER